MYVLHLVFRAGTLPLGTHLFADYSQLIHKVADGEPAMWHSPGRCILLQVLRVARTLAPYILCRSTLL